MEETLSGPSFALTKKKTRYIPNIYLRRERALRGWSQTFLAEKIGAQATLVNRWENGSAFPSPYYREKLCVLLEKDARSLGLIKGKICDDQDRLYIQYEADIRLAVSSIDWSPDGQKVVSIHEDGSVQIWDASTGYSLLSYKEHAPRTITVWWSPDSKRIASGDSTGNLQIRDISNGNPLSLSGYQTQPISQISWSPDGRQIAVGSFEGTVQILQLRE